ncbi:MAG TPA: hypothetical protein H9815_17545 [Candidatus Ruania gallistercoris]|uniref:Uncharacterized protein n=1 Tax=Candidatus Ruania gallistercoris TaxID=2838746 RepID=A0A9D2J6M6_9MICO|nr:hypothetical protein [Candidatus Ruania gallistercoris]
MTARAGGGRSRRAGMSVLAGAAALALSGCGLLGGGTEESTSTASATSGDADSPEASGDRTIPPQLLECGQDRPADDELQLADVDLGTATWSMPEGFEESFSYVEDNPVEEIATTWYAVPTDPELPSLNVLNVVVYTGLDWEGLADACGRVPLEAVEEQLGRYRDQIGAEPLDEAEMTEVAGMPAITQRIGLSEYSYLGYWLFSETQLLHAYCQWTDESAREVIEPACQPLVESVSVG